MPRSDLQRRDGRHVIVLVSDGGNTTSSKRYNDALEAAQRADAVMYPIVVVPITNDAGRNIGGEHALANARARTPAAAGSIRRVGELDKAFADILRDLRTQYMIGYYPTNLAGGRAHVSSGARELTAPDLQAQTRTGYYGDEVAANARTITWPEKSATPKLPIRPLKR